MQHHAMALLDQKLPRHQAKPGGGSGHENPRHARRSSSLLPARRATRREPPKLAHAQFKSVYRLFQAVKSRIANVAAVAHGQHRLTGRRDGAQAQIIGWYPAGERTAIAIALQ